MARFSSLHFKGRGREKKKRQCRQMRILKRSQENIRMKRKEQKNEKEKENIWRKGNKLDKKREKGKWWERDTINEMDR